MKVMMGVFIGYIMLYMISLLLPNSSNPEVMFYKYFVQLTKQIYLKCVYTLSGYAVYILE